MLHAARFLRGSLLLAALGVLAACNVNQAVDVPPGAEVASAKTVNGAVIVGAGARVGAASTVNGAVRVGAGAQVDSVDTVNGAVTLEEKAGAGEVETVNGSISLAPGARVAGAVTAVNGKLQLAPGAQVEGRLGNVNGAIVVDGARVGGGISTVNGNISIRGEAVVRQGIEVKGGKGVRLVIGDDDDAGVPRIVIGPGARVDGPLVFERKVRLYISEQADVPGPVRGAEAVRFSGSEPPEESATGS